MIRLSIEPTFEAWRDAARPLLEAAAAPSEVVFEDVHRGQKNLWDGPAALTRDAPAPDRPLRLPREFMERARIASFHRDEDRFSLLYRMAYRLTHGERSLLAIAADADVVRLRSMVQAVERDVHAMHAFVRFRQVQDEVVGEHFVAWHRPDHRVLRLAAPFFRDRFASMRWTILTPDESAHWNGEEVVYGPGAPASAAPTSDALEELFRAYYRAIFNPARVNLDVMRGHMPTRHWATMPETRVLGELARTAPERVTAMRASNAAGTMSAAHAFLPPDSPPPGIETLRTAAVGCSACPLFERATQTVFGEGDPHAAIMLVGEQPGDEEDRAGRPFIGPAGRLLDRALGAAELPRHSLYVTNAVKHFKWKEDGPRRLHDRPRPGEVRACRAWLDAELRAVRPRVIVCLGVTAAESFVGSRFSASRYRGRWFETPWARHWMVTYHPAAILRMPEEAARDSAFAELVEHLRAAKREADTITR